MSKRSLILSAVLAAGTLLCSGAFAASPPVVAGVQATSAATDSAPVILAQQFDQKAKGKGKGKGDGKGKVKAKDGKGKGKKTKGQDKKKAG